MLLVATNPRRSVRVKQDPKKEAWRAAIAEAFGDMRQVDVAEATGISQPWVNVIANGRIPSVDKLVLICDRLEVPPELRARLFHLAGRIDPAAPTQPNELQRFFAEARRILGSGERIGANNVGGLPPPPEEIDEALALLREMVEETKQRKRANGNNCKA